MVMLPWLTLLLFVMPGLVPGIHVLAHNRKVVDGRVKPGHDELIMRVFVLALALPDQDQAERGQRRTISGPLHLPDHEARLRPVDHPEALTNPEQADG